MAIPGWDGGQLEDEIRANAWLSAPVDSGLIFDMPFESRWHAAGRLLGIERVGLAQLRPAAVLRARIFARVPARIRDVSLSTICPDQECPG